MYAIYKLKLQTIFDVNYKCLARPQTNNVPSMALLHDFRHGFITGTTVDVFNREKHTFACSSGNNNSDKSILCMFVFYIHLFVCRNMCILHKAY